MKESLYTIISRIEREYAEKTAFFYYNEETEKVASVTYMQFCGDVRRCVTYLGGELGLLTGRHIAILAKNSYEYIVSVFACLGSGAVAVPLNIEKSLDDILYELELADVEAVLHDGAYLEREPELTSRFSGKFPDIKGFYGLAESALTEIPKEDSLAMIMFTSGTTAKSKGVMLSQRNIAMQFEHPYANYIEKGLTSFVVLPMFHVVALMDVFIATYSGRSVSICSELRNLYRDMRLLPGGSMMAVPSIMKSFYKDVMTGHAERLGKNRVFISVGAQADIAILTDMVNNGFIIMQGYGLTETSGCGTVNTSQESRHTASVGTKYKGTEYMLDGEELCMRGDAVMLGYYKDPEATAHTIDSEGWLHTGDLARVDDEGYFYLTGRKKNLIILASGENINPEELEALLLKNADIRETVVKEKDGRICAEIFCDEAKRDEISDFITELDRTLPYYKQIALTEFRDVPFERTETGKIKRTKG